jgi:hypothetical protein
LNGTITRLSAELKRAALPSLTRRAARANNWDNTQSFNRAYPPFKHVIYIIKENRTYDQSLAICVRRRRRVARLLPARDFAQPSRLAERFGLFDRFFCNAEVSSQGHVWSTAAYVTDYGEKTIPSLYSDRRAGNDRGDVDEPAAGIFGTPQSGRALRSATTASLVKRYQAKTNRIRLVTGL